MKLVTRGRGGHPSPPPRPGRHLLSAHRVPFLDAIKPEVFAVLFKLAGHPPQNHIKPLGIAVLGQLVCTRQPCNIPRVGSESIHLHHGSAVPAHEPSPLLAKNLPNDPPANDRVHLAILPIHGLASPVSPVMHQEAQPQPPVPRPPIQLPPRYRHAHWVNQKLVAAKQQRPCPESHARVSGPSISSIFAPIVCPA